MSPSKFRENLERKHKWRDLLQYRNCRLNQNMHGKCILSHIVRSKFILKSRFSHALLNKYVSWSTKHGECTWQSLPCHIENMFEQQKAFLLQIKADWIREISYTRWTVYWSGRNGWGSKETEKNHELSGKLGCEITHVCAMKRKQCSAAIFVGNLRRQTPLHRQFRTSTLRRHK